MSFTITSIPNADDNPSDSQSGIKTNFDSIIGYDAVDHVDHGSPNAGQHKHSRYPANVTPPAATGFQADTFTAIGTADATSSNLMFQNKNFTAPLSGVRAYGAYNNLTKLQDFNIASVTNPNPGEFVVIMNANVVNGTNYGILIESESGSFSTGSIPGYQVVSNTTFNLLFRAYTAASGTNPGRFTFIVYQI